MSISLDKATQTAGVVLAKKKILGVKAEIVLATDISSSMDDLYARGTVQDLITRLLGIGMNMDVNKAIDVYAFNTKGFHVDSANESNYANFVRDVFRRRVSLGGGTAYAPVMDLIVKRYGTKPTSTGFFGKLFGSKPVTKDYPTVVFFVTDGENADHHPTEELIRSVSNQPIFWQFVGIGNAYFSFLKRLDSMEGRYMDNANFFEVNDLNKISDEELYDRLLAELPSWLLQVKAKGMIG